MKPFTILLLLIFIQLIGYPQECKFTLEGEINSSNNVKARLSFYTSRGYVAYDSAEAVNGKFSFSGTLDEPVLAMLSFSGSINKILFIGNEHIQVRGSLAEPEKIEVLGSPLTDEFNQYNQMIRPIREQMMKLSSQQETGGQQGKSVAIPSGLFEAILDSTEKFIHEHPRSYISLYNLRYYRLKYDSKRQQELFQALDSSLRHSTAGRNLEQIIDIYSIEKGMPAPEFDFTDMAGKKTNLSSFKGNYTFLVFWASWCTPCIEEMPQVRRTAQALEGKKFKVILLSVDENEMKWKESVAKNDLNRIVNGRLEKSFNDPVAVHYDVTKIPSNFLIDPNGRIVAVNLPAETIYGYLTSFVKE